MTYTENLSAAERPIGAVLTTPLTLNRGKANYTTPIRNTLDMHRPRNGELMCLLFNGSGETYFATSELERKDEKRFQEIQR